MRDLMVLIFKYYQMNTISIFNDACGLDFGFEKAGFQTILANEYDKKTCKRWINNLNDQLNHNYQRHSKTSNYT